jgi:hypothetical protein
MRIHADQDQDQGPGQNLKPQKLELLHEKYTLYRLKGWYLGLFVSFGQSATGSTTLKHTGPCAEVSYVPNANHRGFGTILDRIRVRNRGFRMYNTG